MCPFFYVSIATYVVESQRGNYDEIPQHTVFFFLKNAKIVGRLLEQLET